MGDLNQVLSDGKWVVHNSYGVGQIRGYETKMINGKEVAYYRVETENSTFWVPLDQLDSDRLRPLSTKGEFKQAIKILELPPREMDPDHTHRKYGKIRPFSRRHGPPGSGPECTLYGKGPQLNRKGSPLAFYRETARRVVCMHADQR